MWDVTGVILAGGKSSRMGINKAYMCINQNTMIKGISNELNKIFSNTIIIGNQPLFMSYHLNLPVKKDIYEGCGPLGGIHAALTYSGTPYIFVIGCDMPYVNLRLISFLVSFCGEYDAIIPKIKSYPEPLFGIYGKECLGVIEKSIRSNKYKVSNIFKEINIKYVTEEEIDFIPGSRKSFININTPRDFFEAADIKVKKG